MMEPVSVDVLQILDRLVAPLTSQIVSLGDKLDRVVEQTSQISVVKQGQDLHDARLGRLEEDAKDHLVTLAMIKGRNQVLTWSLGILGTAVAAVGAAGVIHLLGWH
jgi:hypothetical protein